MALPKVALSLCAHPDDAEFGCAGTLALLQKRGWDIHIATSANGDGGSAEYGREEIARIRKGEATKAAATLDGQYHCLESSDVFVMYDEPTIRKAIGLIRKVKPSIVFTHSPVDYMVDHIMTSTLSVTGCFCCGVPNVETPPYKTFEPVPYLYYVDAMEGKDNFGNEIKPSFIVDISDTLGTKEKMLCCHESQRNWLMQHHGMDEYVESMKRWSSLRGSIISVKAGEGFRQHLGHAFPQDNILEKELGGLVHKL
jgi:LmbE family N-acetylglucosaminyl deacetylase